MPGPGSRGCREAGPRTPSIRSSTIAPSRTVGPISSYPRSTSSVEQPWRSASRSRYHGSNLHSLSSSTPTFGPRSERHGHLRAVLGDRAGPSRSLRPMPGALLTDLYELNMAASYLRRGMTGSRHVQPVRPHPPAAAAGSWSRPDSRRASTALESFSFDEDELGYLGTIGFDERDDRGVPQAAVRRRGLGGARGPDRARGRADHGGHRVAPGRAAGRDAAAEPGDAAHDPRRRRPRATVLAAPARTWWTSRSGARTGSRRPWPSRAPARSSGSPPPRTWRRRAGTASQVAGTMAHSFIEAFPSEVEAFRAFADDHPDRTTFLVDTYDTLNGVANAIDVVRELELTGTARRAPGQRRPRPLAREARALLDEAGLAACADLRQRRPGRARGAASWCATARRWTRSASGRRWACRPTRRTWTRSTSWSTSTDARC